MSTTGILYSFIGGAIVGAAGALRQEPPQQKGILCTDNEIDALVEQLTEEMDAK